MHSGKYCIHNKHKLHLLSLMQLVCLLLDSMIILSIDIQTCSSGLVGRTAGEDSKSSDQRSMKFLHTERMTDELQQGFEAGLTHRKEEVSLGGKVSQQGVQGAKATDESIVTWEDGGKEDKEEELEVR